jgi:hypothetical protein
VVVDTEREDIRKAGIVGPARKVLAAVPVYDVTTKFTSQSVTDAASDANDAKSTINTYGKTLPWILAVVGIIALIAGLVLAMTGRAPREARVGHLVPGSVRRGRPDHHKGRCRQERPRLKHRPPTRCKPTR